MQKNYLYGGLLALSLALSACTSSYNNIDKDGNISGDVVFPEMSEATLPEGVFITDDEVNILATGITKRDLYRTLGRPHFREIHGAREWNYILKFRKDDQSIKTCLLKIVFDDDKAAQKFYWQPGDCDGKSHTFNLHADALFRFAKSDIVNARTSGTAELGEVAKTLIANGNDDKVVIVGHTDHIGSDAANQVLSEKRADSVKNYLVDLGVKAANISTKGMGERQPVVTCAGKSGQQQIDCLAPNRRVTITVSQQQ